MNIGCNITDLKIGLLSAVEELAGVHAFRGDEEFFSRLEFVGISEVNHG